MRAASQAGLRRGLSRGGMEEAAAALLGALAGLLCSLLAAIWYLGLEPPRPRAPRTLKVSASSCLVCCPCSAAYGAGALAGIEDLCLKRELLHSQLEQEEEEKTKIHNNICSLTKKLTRVNKTLARKMAPAIDFKKTSAETKAAS